jgi:Flp pilus assembly protein TadD
LGDDRPRAGQLPANASVGDRRDALSDRLGGEGRDQARQDRQQNRDDRQQGRDDTRQDRTQNRDDRQQTRNDRQGDRQQTRDDRQGNRQDTRGDRQENRQEARGERQSGRQDNREQRRQDWQQQRDDIREDWQEHRDQAREDWQNWFDDNYGRYGGWYNGYASGYWGQWDYLWDEHPVAAVAGLTWWGANALAYGFGYGDYYNPYYTDSMPAYYTEPIITTPMETVIETVQAPSVTVVQPAAPAPSAAAPAPSAGAQPPAADSSPGITEFDQARAAFLEGHYEQALKLTDKAVAQMPRDAVLHEFRSLVLFALERYPESAATIHAVLDVGPGWDWKTLSSLYPSVEAYQSQLRALEAACQRYPQAADARFLLGYHYLTCGFVDQALTEFRKTVELQPRDAVAKSLVATLAPRGEQPGPAPAREPSKAIPPDSIAGSWSAGGEGKGKYSMSLRKDGSFTWGFTRGKRKQEVKGVYTVEDNVLAMEPDSGGVMLAEITSKEPDGLFFKMIGGGSDPGLEFRRDSSKAGK